MKVFATVLLSASVASSARADGFDVTGYVTREGATYVLDEPALVDALESIVGGLRPVFGSTGETTGAGGFALSLGTAWAPARDTARASLAPISVAVRKGLPAGFELGVTMAHEPDLGMTLADFALRWSWLEGDPKAPDVGIRLGGGAIVGHPQLTLFDVGLDLVVGYPVAVAGVVRIAPYGGYAFRFARSIERRIAIVQGSSPDAFVTSLPAQNVFLNHALVGLRIQARPLDLGIEASLGTTVALAFQLGLVF